MEAVGRTRNALGEIGNRLTNKGVTSVKDKGAAGGPGSTLCPSGNTAFAVPSGPAPVARGTKTLVRANSVVMPPTANGIGQRIANKSKSSNLIR
jgi:hypothetical protein